MHHAVHTPYEHETRWCTASRSSHLVLLYSRFCFTYTVEGQGPAAVEAAVEAGMSLTPQKWAPSASPSERALRRGRSFAFRLLLSGHKRSPPTVNPRSNTTRGEHTGSPTGKLIPTVPLVVVALAYYLTASPALEHRTRCEVSVSLYHLAVSAEGASEEACHDLGQIVRASISVVQVTPIP